MRVREKYKKRLNFKLFILAILSNVMVMAQTATNPLTNTNGIVDNTDINNMFYSQNASAGCCGNNDSPTERAIVTYEALNLTITSTILSHLQHSTSTYTDDVNSGPSLLEWNGGISVGDVVNIYMVYLNDNVNRRGSSNYAEFTFEDDIVAVGMDWRQTLWFSGTRFSTGDYPKYSAASNKGRFRDRKFEPANYNGGVFLNAWDNQTTTNDWFQVVDANGTVREPNYNGTAIKKFRLGCNNGEKGDFFRVITKASCTEPTGAGSIGNPQNNCGSFDPSTITNTTAGSGGTQGTPTYFWESSTTSSSGPWTTIGSSNSTTYDPPTISQTTWYRRGYYRCDASAAVYTDAVEMTVGSNPSSAGSIGNAQSNCSSFDPTTITDATSPSGGSTPLNYIWEYSTNSSTGPWTDIPPPSGTSTVFSSDCDNATGWSGDINTLPDATTNGLWCIFSSPTGSTGTGPNSAQSGSYFFYVETSGSGQPYNASIVTQALDLSGATSAQLTFYLHAYGATIGTLNLGVSTSSSGPFTTEYTVTGQQQTSESDPWTLVTVDLSNYVGQTVYLEYDYTSGAGANPFTGDIAIDNISVTKVLTHGPTYDPSSISQTTWYRRGVYGNGCTSSSASYTSSIEMFIGGTEPNNGGQINGAEQQCTEFNPGVIVSSIDASGGSGGTPTYFWEYSTSSNTGPWTVIANSNSSSYDPPTLISQTTWYRRGYYRCDQSAAVYSFNVVQKTILPTPNATASSSENPICVGQSTTLSAAAVSGASYEWRISGNSNVLSTSQTYTVSPSATTNYELTVYENFGGTICSSTDNVIITVNSLPNVSVSGGSSQAVCEGSTVTLSGAGASSYSWDNGVTNGTSFAAPSSTTVYTVTGTDGPICPSRRIGICGMVAIFNG